MNRPIQVGDVIVDESDMETIKILAIRKTRRKGHPYNVKVRIIRNLNYDARGSRKHIHTWQWEDLSLPDDDWFYDEVTKVKEILKKYDTPDTD